MNKAVFFLFVLCICFTLFIPVFAVSGPGKNQNIVLKKFSGTIRISTPSDETIVLTQRDKIRRIPLGSRIKAVIGTAEIFCYGVQVNLDEGQAVIVSKNYETDEIEFFVPKESPGNVNITAGTSAFLMSKGAGISAGFNELDEQEIKVIQRGVKLITPFGAENLKIGSVINADLTAKEREEGKAVVPEPLPAKIDEASPSVPE